MNANPKNMKALDIAKTFIGEKEKPNNGGFYNPKLQAMMTEAGHKSGEAWCCYFAEACFCEAAKDDAERLKKLRHLFSANCVQTYKNFAEAGYTISNYPIAGALVIFQKYKGGEPTTQGHAAIVDKDINHIHFLTVEGNTNRAGEREGTSILNKQRNTKKLAEGLNVLGFVLLEV